MNAMLHTEVLNRPITPDEAADPEALEATRKEMLATAKKFASTAVAMLDERKEAEIIMNNFLKREREAVESLEQAKKLRKHWEAKMSEAQKDADNIRREAITPRKITFATPTDQQLLTTPKDNMKKASELLAKKDEEIDINYVRTLVASAMKQQSKVDTSRRYQEETSIARGEEQLDMKTDVKRAVKLDMELDMKISHGREGGAGGMRERRRRSPGRSRTRDTKIVNQENKNSADIITWREYEALRNEMRREFRTKDDELKGTVDEIKQTLDATNVTVTGLADQMTDIQRNLADMRLAIENLTAQQQQDDDEDPELEDDAHNARGAPRGHRPRGWVPLGRNGRGHDEEDGLGKPKFSIPKFEGGADVEEYLTWELKIEKLWSLHPNYSEDKKIKLASSEFDGYALRWWDSLVRNRDEDGAQPIRTWHAMKEVMTSRFVPTNYMRNIFDKLTLLRQGVKTVDEYYMEMEMLMQRGRVHESLEMTMQRFLNGLKYDVKGIVRHYTYTDMNQLLHHAREAESQLAEEAKVKGRATGAGSFTPRAPSTAGTVDALRSLLYSA
ncbi:hypothetical protein QYE76_009035 [Lolium multiflorum]|uniref:Retrotransposon gag domain-containing protein n=1 Tax=Lolium multiflorum TaxID=4521 RepID=A0AAD8TUI4_LOLMU|nr:hypothetical protein QYE76_009035 [Lolium multiflorum]